MQGSRETISLILYLIRRRLISFDFVVIFVQSEALDVTNGHRSKVLCARFNPKTVHEIISGGWDDTVQFWDTRQPYALRRITGVHICGEGLDISKNGKEVCP